VPGGVAQLGSGNREAAAAALIQNSSLDGLEPPWVRPTPPRLPPQEGEVCTWCCLCYIAESILCLQLFQVDPTDEEDRPFRPVL